MEQKKRERERKQVGGKKRVGGGGEAMQKSMLGAVGKRDGPAQKWEELFCWTTTPKILQSTSHSISHQKYSVRGGPYVAFRSLIS